MKITNSEVIKSGERELIDSITGELDWKAIEVIFKQRHKLDIQDDVECKHGDIVVFDNKVAYKLDFEVKLAVSLLVDRQGNALSLTTSGDMGDGKQEESLENEEKLQIPESEEPLDLENHLESSDMEDIVEVEEDSDEILPKKNVTIPQRENVSDMASKIADMISEINEK